MLTRLNELDGLNLEGEYDAPYFDIGLDDEDLSEFAAAKIVIQGSSDAGVMEGCHYLSIDDTYEGELSPGQQELYDILLSFQKSAIYTITTVGKLAETLGLRFPMSVEQRLENLQSLGAISGFN